MAAQMSKAMLVTVSKFRSRIRVLRAWKLASLGGSAGCVASIAALIGDWNNLWDAPAWLLIGLPAIGMLSGACVALVERYSDAQVARSIDRRAKLEDRLTTAYEAPEGNEFLPAVRDDALEHLGSVKPGQIFPMRFQRPQLAFAALIAAVALVYLLADTDLLRPLAARLEAEQLKQAAVEVEQVAKPFLLQADRPNASTDEKKLAANIESFTRDLNKGRMSKEEALERANQLAAEAQQIEAQRALAMSQSLDSAKTAGDQLQQMANKAAMSKTDSAQLADRASALQQQLASLQQQIDDAKSGRSNVSELQLNAMEQKLAELQKEFHQVQLSQAALDMMNKLASSAQYQEAMRILGQLQEQADAQAAGQPGQLSEEQAKAMAARLEQLAKQLDTDAKLKNYAEQLLQAALTEQLENMQLSQKMLGAFGLPCNQPGMGLGGRGGTNPGVYMGNVGKLYHFDKSSFLNMKYQDRVVTSLQGKSGPETYTEELGPSQLTPRSGIPYENILPKYEKTAESALSKGDVPPDMRSRVRDYFASLHQPQ
jgi:hypothetical protein